MVTLQISDVQGNEPRDEMLWNQPVFIYKANWQTPFRQQSLWVSLVNTHVVFLFCCFLFCTHLAGRQKQFNNVKAVALNGGHIVVVLDHLEAHHGRSAPLFHSQKTCCPHIPHQPFWGCFQSESTHSQNKVSLVVLTKGTVWKPPTHTHTYVSLHALTDITEDMFLWICWHWRDWKDFQFGKRQCEMNTFLISLN